VESVSSEATAGTGAPDAAWGWRSWRQDGRRPSAPPGRGSTVLTRIGRERAGSWGPGGGENLDRVVGRGKGLRTGRRRTRRQAGPQRKTGQADLV